ncbi:uncharacterized protein MYCFIDRAFT_198768 [Pseudocercospora fijiensis CIRAD86]|uniref:Peptidase S33 tripeptidyl aminopeptidase-like C-terminal domain-containing protein n=1 Tax=Pseudocercospora fijiensis (strain CIRAD86) TaxID=383855 RepID=M3A7I7_PSEFD|nr:uncharacterized protein MYCFIDRAFT_198768 [Pseudocercospora fijiensis CIRAD86]EME80581.1 hypothetical protein MYCFIDRAFT_198768 [Pseudocercospora fijiensis CIRAD86]
MTTLPTSERCVVAEIHHHDKFKKFVAITETSWRDSLESTIQKSDPGAWRQTAKVARSPAINSPRYPHSNNISSSDRHMESLSDLAFTQSIRTSKQALGGRMEYSNLYLIHAASAILDPWIPVLIISTAANLPTKTAITNFENLTTTPSSGKILFIGNTADAVTPNFNAKQKLHEAFEGSGLFTIDGAGHCAGNADPESRCVAKWIVPFFEDGRMPSGNLTYNRHRNITIQMRFASNFATGLSALATTTLLQDNKSNKANKANINNNNNNNNNNNASPTRFASSKMADPPSYTASTCDLICRSRIVFPVVYASSTIGISMAMTAQNSWDWCNANSEMCKSSITSTCNMISEKLVRDSRPTLLDDKCDDNCLLRELETSSQKAAFWAMDWAIGGINGTGAGDVDRDLMEIKRYLENSRRDSQMAEIVTEKNLLWMEWPTMFEERLPIGGEDWNGVTGDAIMLLARFFDAKREIPGSVDDKILLPGPWLKTDSSGFAKMWERLATYRAADVRNSWLGKMARAVYEVVQSGDVKSREQSPTIFEAGRTTFPTWTGPSGISPKDFIFIANHVPGEKIPDFEATFSRHGNDVAKRAVTGDPIVDEIFMVEKYDVHSNTHYSRYCMDAAAPGEIRGDYRRWVEVDGQGLPTTEPPTHFWLHKSQLKKVVPDDFKPIDVSKEVDAGEGPSTHNVDAANQPAVAVQDKLASTYEFVAEEAMDKLRVAIPILRGPDKIAYNIVKASKGKSKNLYGDLHGVLQSDPRDPIRQTKMVTAEEHLQDQSPELLEDEPMSDAIKQGEEEAEERAKKQKELEKEYLKGLEDLLSSLPSIHSLLSTHQIKSLNLNLSLSHATRQRTVIHLESNRHHHLRNLLRFQIPRNLRVQVFRQLYRLYFRFRRYGLDMMMMMMRILRVRECLALVASFELEKESENAVRMQLGQVVDVCFDLIVKACFMQTQNE